MEENFEMKIAGIVFSIFIYSHAFAITEVKISFLEALAPKDTTSSERFQKEYDFAVQTGIDLTKKELAKCGYQIIEEKEFYDASDTLQALEKAKTARENGAWMIIGPRRSNHYLLTAKGADSTPSVSTMASATEVFELSSSHLTLGKSNSAMADALAKETKLLNKNKLTYLTIVSEDCVTCRDFAASFDAVAKNIGLNKLGEIKITGEQPDLSAIQLQFMNLSPHIVLLPNYSKVTSYLIGAIQTWEASTFFVGGDGWGDNKFGFVHESPQSKKANGITVKGFPPADQGLKYFVLGKKILKDPTRASAFPASGTAQALLKSIEGTRDLLCKERPKTKEEFATVFAIHGRNYFKNPWGVSIFKLLDGEIKFSKTVR